MISAHAFAVVGLCAVWCIGVAACRAPFSLIAVAERYHGLEGDQRPGSVKTFVEAAVARRPGSVPMVACFYAVRDLAYALDGAHDADGLLVQGRGDCLAKSELMRLAAQELGIPARYVCWLYLLPDVVPEVAALPSRLDVHRAAQVRVHSTWVLADATHHLGLRATPLPVSDWDGRNDTQPGHPPVGPIIVEDGPQDAAKQAREQVRHWIASCPPPILARWRSAYIAWLRQHE